MAADAADYARYLGAGKRVRVGVPLADGEAFQEWAVVSSLHGDLLDLELSRDFLPKQARIELGGVVILGVLDRKEKLCCRGIVAGTGGGRLALRLIDPLVPFEPREFFRQDVSLPIEYRVPAHQDRSEIEERWRQTRWGMEFAAQVPELNESAELAALREEIRARLERRKNAPAVAANVSGGGARLELKERLRQGMLIELSFYLPHSEKLIETVAEVVQVKESDRGSFTTALRFRFIDEGDRDRLIAQVNGEQLRRLARQAPWQHAPLPPLPEKRRANPLRIAVGLVILALLIGYQVRSILASRERGEKHEIELVFEKGISDLLKQKK